jgi:hypothetical protein
VTYAHVGDLSIWYERRGEGPGDRSAWADITAFLRTG